jgi:hypothetical protein
MLLLLLLLALVSSHLVVLAEKVLPLATGGCMTRVLGAAWAA